MRFRLQGEWLVKGGKLMQVGQEVIDIWQIFERLSWILLLCLHISAVITKNGAGTLSMVRLKQTSKVRYSSD